MSTARTGPLATILVTALVLAPVSLRAQAYLAPLTMPPASVGRCLPLRQVPVHGDTAHVVQRHLVLRSASPGSARDIILVTGRGQSYVYSDMTHLAATRSSWKDRTVIATMDTLGRMHGTWMSGTESVPDSLLRKRPDSATIHNLRSFIKRTDSPRTPLSAADEAQVRAMSRWMLRRCS